MPPPLAPVLTEAPAAALMMIAADAPLVVLSGLTLQNSSMAPAISVAGELRVEACQFDGNAASAIVIVRGGRAHVQDSRFVANGADADRGDGVGSAIHVEDGHLTIEGSVFEANSGREGGALHVTGASVVSVSHSVFQRNRASGSGGAVHAASYARVSLRNRTLLDGNHADGFGDNLAVDETASCSYVLPAPAGHWIASFVHCDTTNSRSISLASPPNSSSRRRSLCGPDGCCPGDEGLTLWPLRRPFDEEVPFRCAPGVIGSADGDEASQVTPTCSGACPGGSFCEAGTLRPSVCPLGHYCPPGVASGIPCKAGTYNPNAGSDSAAACVQCSSGFYCRMGEVAPTPCPVHTYSLVASGANTSAVCVKCPANAITYSANSTSADACKCAANYYAVVAEGERLECVPCMIGTNCSQPGGTLANLTLLRGYYRPSPTSVDLRACPDAMMGCADGRAVCEESLGGCKGGSDPTDACRNGLGGIFCQSCLRLRELGASPALYVKASSVEPARCEACTVDNSNGASLLGAVLGCLMLTAVWFYCCGGDARRRARDSAAARSFVAKARSGRCLRP